MPCGCGCGCQSRRFWVCFSQCWSEWVGFEVFSVTRGEPVIICLSYEKRWKSPKLKTCFFLWFGPWCFEKNAPVRYLFSHDSQPFGLPKVKQLFAGSWDMRHKIMAVVVGTCFLSTGFGWISPEEQSRQLWSRRKSMETSTNCRTRKPIKRWNH